MYLRIYVCAYVYVCVVIPIYLFIICSGCLRAPARATKEGGRHSGKYFFPPSSSFCTAVIRAVYVVCACVCVLIFIASFDRPFPTLIFFRRFFLYIYIYIIHTYIYSISLSAYRNNNKATGTFHRDSNSRRPSVSPLCTTGRGDQS